MDDHLYYKSGSLYAKITSEKKEYFYENGSLKTIENYHMGKREGGVFLYWPNQQLKRKCLFHQGLRHGLDEMWSEEGVKVDEGCYEMGKAVGKHYRWSKNGSLIEEIEYLSEGRFNFKQWDDEGNLRVEAIWKDPLHYCEKSWDRFEKIWIEKKGRWEGKKLVYL